MPWRKVLIFFGVVLVVVGWRVFAWGAPVQEIEPAMESAGTEIANPTSTPTASASAEVTVHIVGPVRRPGVVTLPAGSRAVDALAAAGGLLPDAGPLTINLARVVLDGEQIDPTAAVVASGQVPENGGPIELNSASADQLDELPGVGPVLADRIVSYRQDVGRFESVDQLQEVPGIGSSRMAELRDMVTVAP